YLSLLGFTPKYGVRPLKGIIRTELRKPLSRMIVKEEIKAGDTVEIKLKEEDSRKHIDWVITSETI
ncbi:MAG TPA: hypothetical protein PKW69_13955, partial [Niabella sp.]|nr:hypothetical protein [Niabella sp.]